MKYAYSYSRLSDFGKCGFMAKSKHIDKIPQYSSPELEKGRLKHEIFCAYTKACYEANKPSLFEQWLEIAYKVLSGRNFPTDIEKEILDSAKSFCESKEIDLASLAAVEERFAINEKMEFVEYFSEGVMFRAVIDKLYLMGESAKVVDYKTGFGMDIDEFQLEIYAWIVMLKYPQINRVDVEYYFTQFEYEKQFTITREDMTRIQKKIMSRIAGIEKAEEFKPNLGSQCATCSYWGICPLMQRRAGDIKMPTTKEEARVLVEEVIAIEKRDDELKTILKEFCKKAGSVSVGDMEAKFKTIENKKWNMAALVEWANKSGIAILECLNVDSRKVKKLNPPTDLYQTSKSLRFGIGKVKDDEE